MGIGVPLSLLAEKLPMFTLVTATLIPCSPQLGLSAFVRQGLLGPMQPEVSRFKDSVAMAQMSN
jgi:hypothetical protein